MKKLLSIILCAFLLSIMRTGYIWQSNINQLNQLFEKVYAAPIPKPTYVTRAEAVMALLLSRTLSVPEVHSDGRFMDVKKTDWFDRYITIAERYGIITADPATHKIHPHDPVNRAQFLKMLAFTFGLPRNSPTLFTDVSPLSWYAPFAGIAEQYKLFPRSEKNPRLGPDRLLTHNETATSIHTVVTMLQESGTAEEDLESPANRASLKLGLYLTTAQDIKPFIFPEVPIALTPSTVERQNIPLLRSVVLALVNAERSKKSLPSLQSSTALERSAQSFAEEMVARGFFGHLSPSGETLRDRMHRSGYYDAPSNIACHCALKFKLGENIARGQKTPLEVMTSWMESPAHRAAILSPDFQDIGIGIRAGMWVQHFGGVQRE